jgi:hypothetical protein
MTHELEISVGRVDFVCEARAESARLFTGKTQVGMIVRLNIDEMPFALSDLAEVAGRRASNCGSIYHITADQAAALKEALIAKVAAQEAWSAAYLAAGKPIFNGR